MIGGGLGTSQDNVKNNCSSLASARPSRTAMYSAECPLSSTLFSLGPHASNADSVSVSPRSTAKSIGDR